MTTMTIIINSQLQQNKKNESQNESERTLEQATQKKVVFQTLKTSVTKKYDKLKSEKKKNNNSFLIWFFVGVSTNHTHKHINRQNQNGCSGQITLLFCGNGSGDNNDITAHTNTDRKLPLKKEKDITHQRKEKFIKKQTSKKKKTKN